MQGEAAGLAGEASGQGEEAPPQGLGGRHRLAQTNARRPEGQVAITCTASQAALAGKRPDGRWLSPTRYLRSRMASRSRRGGGVCFAVMSSVTHWRDSGCDRSHAGDGCQHSRGPAGIPIRMKRWSFATASRACGEVRHSPERHATVVGKFLAASTCVVSPQSLHWKSR